MAGMWAPPPCHTTHLPPWEVLAHAPTQPSPPTGLPGPKLWAHMVAHQACQARWTHVLGVGGGLLGCPLPGLMLTSPTNGLAGGSALENMVSVTV